MFQNYKILAEIVFFSMLILFFLFIQSEGPGFFTDTSAHGMAIARSIEYKTPFFVYYGKYIDKEGKINYEVYNRFSPVSFFLIKFISGFSTSFSQQIYAARQLMNFFHASSLFVGYLIASRVLNNRVLGAGAAFLTFSTFYSVYYKDMIFNDVPQLFFCLLIIYLIISNASTRTLVIVSFLSALTGWQFFSILTAWLVLDFIIIINGRKTLSFDLFINSFLKGKSVILFLFSVLICIAIIFFMLINESFYMNQDLRDTGSYKSIISRVGLSRDKVSLEPYHSTRTNWEFHLRLQIFRFMMSFYPFYIVRTSEPCSHILDYLRSLGIHSPDISCYAKISEYYADLLKYREHGTPPARSFSLFISNITAFNFFIFSIFIFALYRQKNNEKFLYTFFLLFLAPVLWLVVLRQFLVIHDFQSMFYIPPVLGVYSILLSLINPRFSFAVALTAFILFADNHLYLTEQKKYIARPLPELTAFFEKANEENVSYKVSLYGLEYRTNFDIYYYISGHKITSAENADVIITLSANKKIAEKYPLKKVVFISN